MLKTGSCFNPPAEIVLAPPRMSAKAVMDLQQQEAAKTENAVDPSSSEGVSTASTSTGVSSLIEKLRMVASTELSPVDLDFIRNGEDCTEAAAAFGIPKRDGGRK